MTHGFVGLAPGITLPGKETTLVWGYYTEPGVAAKSRPSNSVWKFGCAFMRWPYRFSRPLVKPIQLAAEAPTADSDRSHTSLSAVPGL